MPNLPPHPAPTHGVPRTTVRMKAEVPLRQSVALNQSVGQPHTDTERVRECVRE